MAKRAVFIVLLVAAFGRFSTVALADEVVKFTNGAEMPVVSHTVEKGMVKLDLGNNSFIAFPMAMVDKIVAAGKDVFLNPTFHPSNQAVPANGQPTVADSRPGGGAPQLPRGAAGVMLGEAADVQPVAVGDTHGDPGMANADVNRRRIFNPAFPPTTGVSGIPQVIVPPSMKAPGRMTLSVPPRPQAPPTSQQPPQPQQIPSNPPENSGGGDSGTPDPPDNNPNN